MLTGTAPPLPSANRLRLAPPRTRPVPAVTRAVAILRLLGKSEEPLGVNAIARELQLIPSTCLHILRALAHDELVAFDPLTRRYVLAAGILTIARSFMRRNSFGALIQPVLDHLSDEYGVTAIAVQVIGLDHMVAVAISRSESPLRLHVEIGSRFPALISATGRCLAAFGGYRASELRRRFSTLRWHRAPTLRQWLREVEATRRNGYSIDEGRYLQGVTILAVPILDARESMTHGIAAVGVSQQMADIGTVALAEKMRTLAASISERLIAS